MDAEFESCRRERRSTTRMFGKALYSLIPIEDEDFSRVYECRSVVEKLKSSSHFTFDMWSRE